MKSEFFRANVGGLVVDDRGRVLACDRADTEAPAWQMPQGGIRSGEEPLEAAYRELLEETGLGAHQLELIAELPGWIAYELPAAFRRGKTGRGQVQKWFLFRLRGPASAVTPDRSEFCACRWVTPEHLLRQVVDFRRPVYRAVFEGLLASLEPGPDQGPDSRLPGR